MRIQSTNLAKIYEKSPKIHIKTAGKMARKSPKNSKKKSRKLTEKWPKNPSKILLKNEPEKSFKVQKINKNKVPEKW